MLSCPLSGAVSWPKPTSVTSVTVGSRPTSSSWINQVKRLFVEITEKRIRRDVFHSLAALERAIKEYLEDHHRSPRPFVWTADADLILGRAKSIYKRTSDSKR